MIRAGNHAAWLLASALVCATLHAATLDIGWQVRPGPDQSVHSSDPFEAVALSWSTAAALDSLKSLLAALCARNSIDPAAFAYHAPSALNVPTIIGHRDGNGSSLTCTRTECPGNALHALLPAIRSDVAALRLHPPTRKRSSRP